MPARLPKRHFAVLGLAWAAAMIVVAWLVLAGREAALERSERTTASMAATVEQQTARTYQAVQLTLAAIADAHLLTPRPRRNEPQFQEMMSRRLADLPFVRAVFIIGADGWIIHDTDYPRTPAVSLADRPYFRAHRAAPELRRTIGPLLQSRSGTGWFLPLTQALGRSQFEGIVTAAVQAEYFEQQFAGIGLAEGDTVALFHSDGTLVASHPPISGRRDFSHLPVFAKPQTAGTFWTTEGLIPGERVVSHRTLAGAPFVVQVSRSKRAALAEWRRTALGAAVGMAGLTILLAWFFAYLARQRRRDDAVLERRLQAEKLEALGRLTGGIAHDLSNTLNIIALNMSLLREAPGQPRVVERVLATTERAVQGGTMLIARLLSFARQRPMQITAIDVGTCVATARPLLAQAAGPGVKLSVEVQPALPPVLCDPTQLDAALINLVVNARDAMARTGRVEVRIYTCNENGDAPRESTWRPSRVCVSVRDTGPGMPEQVRRQALEPFFSTKGEAGTGLGLSQVYGFMQQLGGNITIESTTGEGTSVHLYFPVAPVADSLPDALIAT
jgi:signal transduction histidine kinase